MNPVNYALKNYGGKYFKINDLNFNHLKEGIPILEFLP